MTGGCFSGQTGAEAFIQPLIALGLGHEQIISLISKIPFGWQLDHKQMYYDFRLSRWIRHIEPDSLETSLRETLETAPTIEQGLEWVGQIVTKVSEELKNTPSQNM